MLAVVLAGRYAPSPTVVRLPGTSAGKRMVLTYSIGGAASAALTAPKQQSPVEQPSVVTNAAAIKTPVPPKPDAVDAGAGSSGVSALGNGNINIAALQEHPRPQPDLSGLKRGAGGNVVMDAVIDEHGRISQLTLVSGLGAPIDQSVMAVVSGWTFKPATRDGQPIVSEQEILLHYERG